MEKDPKHKMDDEMRQTILLKVMLQEYVEDVRESQRAREVRGRLLQL